MALRWEVGILKRQYASNGNANGAERRLPQSSSCRSLDEYLCPGTRIELNGNFKGDKDRGRFACLHVVSHHSAEIAMPVLERLPPRGQLQGYGRRT